MPYAVFKLIWNLFISSLFIGAFYVGAFVREVIFISELGVNFYHLVSVEYREYWEHYFIDSSTVDIMTGITGFCVMQLCPRDAGPSEKMAATFFVLFFPLFLLITVTGMLILEMVTIFNDPIVAKWFFLFQVILSIVYSLLVSKIYSPKKATSLSPNDMPDHSQSSELRDCPFCYEKIQQKAIKCRFCGEMV